MPIVRQGKTRGFRVALAYNRLREMIVWGTLAPGMRLVESELMTQLDLGRTPIRTALHRLQSEGFVVGTGKGKESLRVSPLTRTDATDVFEIVGALESIAIRHAAALDRPRRVALAARIRERNVALTRAARADRPDQHRIYDLDAEIHRAFIEPGAGPRVARELGTMKLQAERYMRLYIRAFGDMRPSIAQHDRMARAIRAGDPDAAAAVVREQWEGAAARLGDEIVY
jgi:DNA-binding GntR family transcriptional regulator